MHSAAFMITSKHFHSWQQTQSKQSTNGLHLKAFFYWTHKVLQYKPFTSSHCIYYSRNTAHHRRDVRASFWMRSLAFWLMENTLYTSWAFQRGKRKRESNIFSVQTMKGLTCNYIISAHCCGLLQGLALVRQYQDTLADCFASIHKIPKLKKESYPFECINLKITI